MKKTGNCLHQCSQEDTKVTHILVTTKCYKFTHFIICELLCKLVFSSINRIRNSDKPLVNGIVKSATCTVN